MAVTSPAPRRFRLNDWLALGLDALAQQGPSGLTIEALCRRAGKTKGSFYAHFPAIEAYLAALAGHWRETHTLRLMQDIDKGGPAQDRLIALDRMALALDVRVEQGMRRLAQLDPGVAATCAEIDRERIAYLEKLHGESGRFTPEETLTLARIEYAAFIGFQQLDLGLSPQELHDCYGTFMRLLVRPAIS
ncbi:MAG: TetR/AcrR family transcriptional regulator [Bosea sp.]|uniref:TetR/AcrR family transcriptional regulator n=1 Tax=Bosea sp. (in: a-proteobacteria) TaxID=1871050 RepID=UPI0023880F86|nr:TetR/AcrR family transcriptional regulator [Bosea sp. (in: a-proteobacteria)]MCP4732841.1 TetR/AcrR family transcriptional regulator [Bosea sp. (in: a-proteobacteria)]